MAGNKNSGRRGGMTTANAEYRLATIEECWKLVRKAINDETLDYEYRVELAAKHTVKAIPTELTGGLNANLVAMGTITKNGDNLGFKIGGDPNPPEDLGCSEQAPAPN